MGRFISSWHLMGIISILYLLLIWMSYQQVEYHMQYHRRMGNVLKPRLHTNGSIQLFVKECPVHHKHTHSHLTDGRKQVVTLIKPGTCPVLSAVPDTEIQMEEEWARINVKYPQYVYTVSGWIQVLDVPNYTPKPLRVIILPHSHQDPGWKESFVGYYSSYTRRTLDHIVDKLTENPKLKFIWSEVVFLNKWYNEPDSKRDNLHKLVKNGQFEIVTGGMVMTDEAVAHYTAMLNQLIDGHVWLKNTFGITPNTSWSVDPFGHSPTMTYILKRAGINKMVIQRTHFGIKRHFAKRQDLEFLWRQSWDASGDLDVLCHMMPFLLYSVMYSCGPDPHVCCQFDFHSSKCFVGTKAKSPEPVTDKNIRKLAWALWEQYQKKAQLYRSNVLLVPHGDDFRYSSINEWNEQFGNMDKLIAYMNKDEDMNIHIEYGTVSDYFKSFEDSQKSLGFNLPTLSGDFLPYNDRDDQYWTGFYSVRPLLKHMVRVLQGKLRITETLFTLMLTSQSKRLPVDKSFYTSRIPMLVDGRHAVNLFQHHDAITGTSKHVVMEDYGEILKSSMDSMDELLLQLVGHSIAKERDLSKENKFDFLTLAQPWPFERGRMKLKFIRVDGNWLVVVTNSLTIPWKSAITVRTMSPGVIKTLKDDLPVPSQINPVWDANFHIISGAYAIVFEADLEPLSVKTYMFVKQSSSLTYARVSIYGNVMDSAKLDSKFGAKESSTEMFDIENHLLKASFSSCTGTLQHVQRKTDDQLHQMAVGLVTYGTGSWSNPFRDKSGAYIFMPDGPAKDMEVFYPPIIQLEGPVLSSVSTKLPGVVMTATLYNISGPVGTGVHLDNLVSMGNKEWDNQEIAMRVVSDVVSEDTSLCVDLNGFQMHKKKYKSKLLIQGNFHPVTSAAFIEDGHSERLTLLTSEAHGVASLNGGWLEAVLDRRMMQDDWRGLNEGPHDNSVSPSHFILIPERRDTPGTAKGLSCHLSLLAHLLSDHLDNPPQVAVSKESLSTASAPPNPKDAYFSSVRFLQAALPCSYRLVNLRYLEEDPSNSNSKLAVGSSGPTALMVLHRLGVDCHFNQLHHSCMMNSQVNLNSFTDSKMAEATETTLTGVQRVKRLQHFLIEMKNMEMKTFEVSFHP